ncbi:MAG: response regulator [Rhodospirillaceae bacterium]|nr:response regulator [Rhodospirillaceae bacterium]
MATILLIDDDENITQIMSLFLKGAGHKALIAQDASHGIATANSEHPDMILLDLAMPGISGVDAFKILKQNPKTSEIPIVIFSVHDPKDLDKDIDISGYADYLQKPVEMDALKACIEKVLS